MKVYTTVRTNRYCNIQESTGYTGKGFLNVLIHFRILTDFFTGPEVSIFASLSLNLRGRTADAHRFDSARSPWSSDGG